MDTMLDSELYQQWGERTCHGPCPEGVAIGVNPFTGILIVDSCRRYSCLQCVRSNVKQLDRAARYTRPTALLTFTLLTWDHADNRELINRFARYLALHNPGCSRGLKPPLSSSDLAM